MNTPQFLTVGIVGTGAMGRGIAQLAAQAGSTVRLFDTQPDAIGKAQAALGAQWDKLAEKGKLTPEAAAGHKARLKPAAALADLADCDLLIEAIVERLDVKKSLFAELEGIVQPGAVLATNTSSLSVTAIAAGLKRPARFAGYHFFNPVPLMKLVEVIRALTTSDETYKALFDFAVAIGKEPVTAPDKSGFIVNRLLVPYLLDAIRCYERGLGTKEDIDNAMKLGCGYPMGPLTLLDFVGLDTTYYIANIMFDEYKDPMFAAPPLLKRMVLAGKHGRKSGEGFYKY